MFLYIRLGFDDFFHLALHVAGTMCQPVFGLSDLRLPIKLPKSQIQLPSSDICPLTSDLCLLSSDLCPLTSDLRHLSSDTAAWA